MLDWNISIVNGSTTKTTQSFMGWVGEVLEWGGGMGSVVNPLCGLSPTRVEIELG